MGVIKKMLGREKKTPHIDEVKVSSEDLAKEMSRAEAEKKKAQKEAARPRIYTTKKGENPDSGNYKQGRSGAIVSMARQRVKLTCRLLGISRKKYRKEIKKNRHLLNMSEHEFQERVFALAQGKAEAAAPQG